MPSRNALAPYGLTLVTAFLFLLCAPHVGLGAPLAWITLVPWIRALDRASGYRSALAQGVWLSFLFNVSIYAWGAYAIHEFAQVPWALSILILMAAATVAQPQFWLFGAAYRWYALREGSPSAAPGRILLRAAALAFLYAGLDWIAPKLFADTLGHAFTEARFIRQAAELGGAHLLTFLAAFTNFLLADLLRDRSRARAFAVPGAIAAALALAAWGYGAWRCSALDRRLAAPDLTVRAAAIQANIPNAAKLAAELGLDRSATDILATFRGMSDQALASPEPPQLIVWPETAYPALFGEPRTLGELEREKAFREYAAKLPVPLVMGSYERAGGDRQHNSLIFIPRDPSRLVSYRKHILLHFGDYIPGEEWFPAIRALAPKAVGRHVAGSGETRIPLELSIGGKSETVGFMPIICYESIFPRYVRRGALLGPDVILNVTNDSWFGPIGEPQLHLALARFRSIETRLPQLRVTNTGITALIRQDGSLVEPTRIGEAVWRNYEIPVLRGEEPTLFVRWGDWFGPIALLLGLALGGLSVTGASARMGSPNTSSRRKS